MARKQWSWGMAVSVRFEDVVAELRAVGQGLARAVDVAGALGVGQEEMVAARAALDVDVLAELDGALGADEEEAAVAPDRGARPGSASRRG